MKDLESRQASGSKKDWGLAGVQAQGSPVEVGRKLDSSPFGSLLSFLDSLVQVQEPLAFKAREGPEEWAQRGNQLTG